MATERPISQLSESGLENKLPVDTEKALSDTHSDVESAPAAPVVPAFPPAPEGGLRGWLVIGGSACIIFCALGFANSFGTLEAYLLENQLSNESPSNVSWIGSLMLYMQFLAGMIGGPLFDRYGEKSIWPAAFVFVFAIMMLSLCQTYWEFMLCQGVLLGFSSGMMQFPAFAATSHYFVKKRALAVGLVVSGSSIGGIVFPIALSSMLNNSTLGFGWSLRIVGFIILPLLGFACLAIKARLPPRQTKFLLWSAYTEPLFILLIASLFFIFAGMMTPLFYLPSYAVERGMDPTQAGYLPAVLNGASTVGRIGLGLLADKLGRLNMFTVGAFATAACVFAMSSATTPTGFFVYSAFIGLSSGTVISMGSGAISLVPKDMRNIGTYLGMGFALAGLGALIGPPINGVLVTDYHGDFFQASMFSGALCTVGAILALCSKLATPQGLLGRI